MRLDPEKRTCRSLGAQHSCCLLVEQHSQRQAIPQSSKCLLSMKKTHLEHVLDIAGHRHMVHEIVFEEVWVKPAVVVAHQREAKTARKRSWRRAERRHVGRHRSMEIM